MEPKHPPLAEEATRVDAVDGESRFRIPRTDEHTYRAFSVLQDILWDMSSFAKQTDDNWDAPLMNLSRHLERLFSMAYDTEATEEYERPTVNNIRSDLSIFGDTSIPPRTVTVAKQGDNITLEYAPGFDAADETVFLDPEAEQEELGVLLHYCGTGVKDVHAPYQPSVFEQWRYGRDSRVQVSLQTVGDGIRFGISTSGPERPRLYPAWLAVTQTGGPHAYPTLSRDDQTSVVEYVLEQNDL